MEITDFKNTGFKLVISNYTDNSTIWSSYNNSFDDVNFGIRSDLASIKETVYINNEPYEIMNIGLQKLSEGWIVAMSVELKT